MHLVGRAPLVGLLAVYLVLSLGLFLAWSRRGAYPVDGDETHYLVMASGLAEHGTLELTAPYAAEFRSRRIYDVALDAPGAGLTPRNSHSIRGAHGFFSVHGVGLPALLALPFLLGGVAGAKLFMIALGGMTVTVVWKVAGTTAADAKTRVLATLATCVALPLLPASNQVFPDLVAGTIALSGLYWHLTTCTTRSLGVEGLWAAALVLLPWLHLKDAPTCLLLVAALVAKLAGEVNGARRAWTVATISLGSFALLALYDRYAFGSIWGPYGSGALEPSAAALMVLLGLCLDQNQGFLFQNPVMFVGLFTVGELCRRDRRFAALWALVFLSLLVPNALHPNLYGGWSFSGRFSWSAAVVFMLPTVLGLIKLAELGRKVFATTIGLAFIVQGYFFAQCLRSDVSLYSKPPASLFDSYSILYFPMHSWLPALYDPGWAFRYGPNYGWTLLACIVLALGWAAAGRSTSTHATAWILIIVAGALVVPVAATLSAPIMQAAVFPAGDLPSETGQIEGTARVAAPDRDVAGFITLGPHLPYRKGTYRAALRYSSTAATDAVVGGFEIVDSTTGRRTAVLRLDGTAGAVVTTGVPFDVPWWSFHWYEFRCRWYGRSSIQVLDVRLARDPREPSR